jgi:hypothetical protein
MSVVCYAPKAEEIVMELSFKERGNESSDDQHHRHCLGMRMGRYPNKRAHSLALPYVVLTYF